jgi:hypothetical protein
MEILFHECKIPRKIELWACLISKDTNITQESGDPPLSQQIVPPTSFSHLGNITPNSNEGNGFKTREKKIVQLQNLSATHIKLVMERPYEINDEENRNPLEQVGLVTLTLYGFVVNKDDEQQVPVSPLKQTPLRQLNPLHQKQRSSSSITPSIKRDIASTQTSFMISGTENTPVTKVVMMCSDEDLDKRLGNLERLKRDRANKEVRR